MSELFRFKYPTWLIQSQYYYQGMPYFVQICHEFQKNDQAVSKSWSDVMKKIIIETYHNKLEHCQLTKFI